MRTLLIGLDCAAPEILLNEPRLTNLRRLMSQGCFGRLESVVPPITVPAWMCMATSQDPGSLGVYGFRNRTSYAYDKLGVVTSQSITAPAVWDYFGEVGQVAVIGVPPGFPPRKVNGVSIGCFLTPDTTKSELHASPRTEADALRIWSANIPSTSAASGPTTKRGSGTRSSRCRESTSK